MFFIKMEHMVRIFIYLFAFMFATYTADAATNAMRTPVPGRVSKYVDAQSYSYMYPYLNNKMRTAMNPGTTVNMTNNPIDVIVKTKQMTEPRRVVARTANQSNQTARAATNTTTSTGNGATRRVVARTARNTTDASAPARSGTTTRAVTGRNARDDSARTVTTTTNTTTTESVSSTRCLADYTECMNGYCERESMAYNRCYCSAKLAQIDSQYQDQISDLIIQIIKLKGGGTWTDDEMNEYWMEHVGNYAGENSWVNLENALNINWPTAEERISGQNAFLIGHNYCVQHLRGCAYMSSNLRDSYRSRISRDCNTYEQSLIKIKNAAEAIIEYYNE